MRYSCEVNRVADGTFEALSTDPPLRATGATADEAKRALESEIRYYLELCPCTTTTEPVELDVKHGR